MSRRTTNDERRTRTWLVGRWLLLVRRALGVCLTVGVTSALLAALTACGAGGGSPRVQGVAEAVPLGKGEKLRVVATTTIVGDVVRAVGGDAIELTVLLPPGTDPHSFEPTPQDVVAVADAHVVFVNGGGLEVFLDPLLRNAEGSAAVMAVSDGVSFRRFDSEREGEAGGIDPHVWFDPLNVVVWTRNIERALSTLDPANAEAYAINTRRYQAALRDLDTWIREQVARVPPGRRKLVTDHAVFGYFADRYGFEQVGAVIPGFSSAAEPSAQALVRLEDAIRELGAPAIFVGTTVNPGLAQRVAEDTGIRLVFLYTGSLSEPGGPAESYLALMRYNVSAVVNALAKR